MKKEKEVNKSSPSSLLGVGLDNKDKHKRYTKGENFFIVGGSQKTHEQMVEKALEFSDTLKKSGKSLDELTESEYFEIAKQVGGEKIAWLFPGK